MNGKPEFHEDFIGGPKVIPLHVSTVDFPYDQVARDLGEPLDPESAKHQRLADAGVALAKILNFATDVPLGMPRTPRMIGLRFAAAAWVINPGLFEGSPSATQLARCLGFKNPANFHNLTGAVARHLGITNRAQAHAWNRGKQMGHHGP